MKDKEFLNKVLKEADNYSDRYIDSTRHGMAMMKLLGFKRNEYTISAKSRGEGNGWDEAKIHFRSSYEKEAASKVLSNLDKILDAEFDVDYFVFPESPQINFILMTRTYKDIVLAEKHVHLGNDKMDSIVLKKISVKDRYL